jgi:hypothetical protein
MEVEALNVKVAKGNGHAKSKAAILSALKNAKEKF